MRMSRVGIVLRLSVATIVFGVLAFTMQAAQTSTKSKSSSASKASSTTSTAKVDLNTASEKDLESLPGVGAATAKKIIAGRPYSSVADLSKAGVSAGSIKKITPLVTASGGTAAAASAKADPKPDTKSSSKSRSKTSSKASAKEAAPAAQPASAPAASQPAPAAPAKAAATQPAPAPASQPAPAAPAKATAAAASQGTPGPGTVWVNLESGVYHYPGTRYYGKTKSGKYMPEADAVKAGYHASKDEKKPQ